MDSGITYPKNTLLFVCCLLFYFSIFIGRKNGFYYPELINSYASDLLCMPIVFTIISLGVRKLKKLPNFKLSINMMIFVFIYFSVVFELVLPRMSTAYTADGYDVLCYGFGGIVFYLVQYSENREDKPSAI